MDIGFGLFYYTLIVLLAVILTAATCLASYLVTRNRTYACAFAGFLFYFFDVALVFQDDFLMQRAAELSSMPFFIGSPVASIVIGGGTLVSFWLAICEYIKEQRLAMRLVPGAAFVAGSVAVLLFAEPGSLQMFLFYSMRALLLYWMLAYIAVNYIGTRDDVKRLRMRRHRVLYVALWVLVTLVLMENVVLLLVVGPQLAGSSPLPFFPERNFAENLLVLCCAFAACMSAWKSLSLRRAEPPTQGGPSLETFIDQNLVPYGAARQLSKREAEVLRLVLLGKDNQNIATAMHLAPSTVKVHMHHILQKAERSNRKELIQDFWEFS
ncbi:helix-turn-helix transcriptional regulator [Eggerthella sinensis]|uniref:LuxR family transcriptional regulator n=1 Tax=Eggerthella sinensis TaxID=242230 RepID=A0A3N0IWS1_9ACTN|nr:helix-turn-helix transcriptional regulator [Eggerthella sinensis]RDB68961.1 LuxR family transcriptional regulator [Eggerthella sinensis]RNM41444.1 LuxR family transcriptional regulator [Eggerthella sinensis]